MFSSVSCWDQDIPDCFFCSLSLSQATFTLSVIGIDSHIYFGSQNVLFTQQLTVSSLILFIWTSSPYSFPETIARVTKVISKMGTEKPYFLRQPIKSNRVESSSVKSSLTSSSFYIWVEIKHWVIYTRSSYLHLCKLLKLHMEIRFIVLSFSLYNYCSLSIYSIWRSFCLMFYWSLYLSF